MSSSPILEPRLPEPTTGVLGYAGGAHDDKSIFKDSENRFGADFILGAVARGSAAAVLLMLVALVGVLVVGAYPSIKKFGIHFIMSSGWTPEHTELQFDANGNAVLDETGNQAETKVEGVYGALAFIYGTVVSSALALLFAIPLSLGSALFLVRIGPWLTPTFVKCGILGLASTAFLFGLGGLDQPWIVRSSGLISIIGIVMGLAASTTLLWIAWKTEDPRVGPHTGLQVFLHAGVPIVVLLLCRSQGISWGWTLAWTAAAGAWLGQLGRAGVNILSFMIEFLAAIPSIAYGLWGLFVLVPFLGTFAEPPLNRFFGFVPFLRFLHTDGLPTGRDMLAAGIILAIMILPIITAISRDVLRAVPRIQVEGTQALGATWWQSSWAMLRYGRSGLFGAIMLGLARAAGETMAVTMVIGNINRINYSILEAGQTMASLLANTFKETPAGMQVSALIELGLVLLIMSLIFNIVARYLVVGTESRAGGA